MEKRKTKSPNCPTKTGTTRAAKDSEQTLTSANLNVSPYARRRWDSFAQRRMIINMRNPKETRSEELLKKKIV
jgi:hypothetical protein